MSLLENSYDYCRALTQKTAHNFRFTFLTLPRDKRNAMNALYAFNRITDDLGDDPTVSVELRRTQLSAWRESVKAILALSREDVAAAVHPGTAEVATLASHPALPAVADVVTRHHIPHQYLLDVIDGVALDLYPQPIATFADLQRYCYHVAGAVGVSCIHIWGFRDDRALPLAIDCGLALQLTNILRDLGEDAEHDRIYLPAEDLDRFGYGPADFRQHVRDDRFHALMEFQVDRARQYYQSAEELFAYLDPCGQPILRAMLDIYGGLLQEIRRRQFDVYSERVSLAKWKKLWFAGRAVLNQKLSRGLRRVAPRAS